MSTRSLLAALALCSALPAVAATLLHSGNWDRFSSSLSGEGSRGSLGRPAEEASSRSSERSLEALPPKRPPREAHPGAAG